MNVRAVLFLSNAMPSDAREAEGRRLEAHAEAQGLQLVSTYVASGQPNGLTIDMLIDHCLAREQAGNLVLSDLDLLWIGIGLQDVLERLEEADTIVHVVPPEAR